MRLFFSKGHGTSSYRSIDIKIQWGVSSEFLTDKFKDVEGQDGT